MDWYWQRSSNALPGAKSQNDTIATAITEVSDSLTKLVHDEIELAKAEMSEKVSSLLRGAVAVAVGATFGIFALIFVLLTIAWGLNDLIGELWAGFLIVAIALVLLAAGAGLFAWKKLKVGTPMPQMAIDEAKKIRETVTVSTTKVS